MDWGCVPYIPRISYRFLHRFTYAQRNNTKYKFNAGINFRIRFDKLSNHKINTHTHGAAPGVEILGAL